VRKFAAGEPFTIHVKYFLNEFVVVYLGHAGHKRPRSSKIYARYPLVRTTARPIFLRSRSEYFERAFSASCFVLNGFDNRTSC